jgi:transposase InsO family protein
MRNRRSQDRNGAHGLLHPFLPSRITGSWFYLYLILDVYSRKIVGFEVHQTDSSDHAVDLLRRTALVEGIHALRRSLCSTATTERR